jgi:ribosomal protein S18 acetylase RimI-like enzyme
MGIELQPLTQGDLEWARELRNKNRKFFFTSQEITREQQQKWFDSLKEINFFVIVREGEQVGTISISQEDIIKLGNIIVDERFRGLGVLRMVIEELKSRFDRPWQLEVKKDNQGAIQAYKNLGFEVLETSENSVTMIMK